MSNKIGLISYSSFSEGMNNIKNEIRALAGSNIAISLQETSPMISSIVAGRSLTGKKLVVVWGNVPQLPRNDNVVFKNNINKSNYTNKKNFFNHFQNSNLVEAFLPYVLYNTEDARAYMRASLPDSNTAEFPLLVERQNLVGSGGDGIKLIRNVSHITTNGKLWVVYKKKKDEYRVHFYKTLSGVIELYFQKKLLKREREIPVGQPEDPFKVRNFANGWVFSPNWADVPLNVIKAAARLALSTELSFGAIDILYNSAQGSAWILEVNTAPGAIETTAKWYAKHIHADFLKMLEDTPIVPINTSSNFHYIKNGGEFTVSLDVINRW